MTEKEAYGQAFENGRKLGYEEGYRDGKKRAMEDIAFPKFLVRPTDTSKEELEAILNSPVIIRANTETIIPILPYRVIPVTERLPTKEDATEKGAVLAWEVSVKNWDIWEWSCVRDYSDRFIAWMPLPESPKED